MVYLFIEYQVQLSTNQNPNLFGILAPTLKEGIFKKHKNIPPPSQKNPVDA